MCRLLKEGGRFRKHLVLPSQLVSRTSSASLWGSLRKKRSITRKRRHDCVRRRAAKRHRNTDFFWNRPGNQFRLKEEDNSISSIWAAGGLGVRVQSHTCVFSLVFAERGLMHLREPTFSLSAPLCLVPQIPQDPFKFKSRHQQTND